MVVSKYRCSADSINRLCMGDLSHTQTFMVEVRTSLFSFDVQACQRKLKIDN